MSEPQNKKTVKFNIADDDNSSNSSSDDDNNGMYEGMPKGDFYDSEEDEANERWVSKHYSAPRIKTTKDDGDDDTGAPDPDAHVVVRERPRRHQTDAVLSCPACFTLLCVDCQRHVEYENQFRAMFVQSCRVDTETVLTYDGSVPEEYNPVYCKECGTQVGVFSVQEEIYHFYNVIPS